MVLEDAPADWLDACCWRCGSEEILPQEDDRLLCRTCRVELFGAHDSSLNPVRVSTEAYWESHALERCWRCTTGPVDPDDDVGLCGRCHEELEA